ncbi:hypothetical protein [Domibacillus iocasae]|nr:hypothetical protein [Domibacillus iocasae]
MAIKNIKDQEKQVETLTAEELKLILKSLDHSWFVDFRAAVLIHVLLDSFGRIGKGQGNSVVIWKLKERIASTRAFRVSAILGQTESALPPIR